MNTLLHFIEKLLYYPKAVENRLLLNSIKQKIPQLVKDMRKKDKIKILFVLYNLSKWKTESLYLAMLTHPMFEPVIGVALGVFDYPSRQTHNLFLLENYLKERRYEYVELRVADDIQERIAPDIVFYQQADGGIFESLLFYNLHDILFCYSCYGILSLTEKSLYNSPYQNICWQWFVESPLIIKYAKNVMSNHAKNLVFTGSPMTDELLLDKKYLEDPWKPQPKLKKKIIWAPHHTIGLGKEEIHYGTFLQVAEGMMKIAKKYEEEIQWAFKPHPSLKQKLYYLWGEERTNAYWAFWADSDNCQLEEGKYTALFKHSDAMMHDCASFTVEYLYMQKPCMYLVNGKAHPLNDLGSACYDLYYKGHNLDEIELFVNNVIHGVDPMKEKRQHFFNEYLLPPNGKSACDNIIDRILGL